MGTSTLAGLRCLRCERWHDDAPPALGCESCAAQGASSRFATVYDLDRAKRTFTPSRLAARPPGPMRYRELLPVDLNDAVSMGEGMTPLLRARRLEGELGIRRIFIKDESQNPTWSFKDRSASLAVSVARRDVNRGLIVASTGNAAAATAAYASSVDLPAVILVAQGVEPVMNGLLHAYGATVAATRTKRDRWRLMRSAVTELGLFPNSNAADPPVGTDPRAVDGYKPIAYEMWEQLGHRSPTHVYMPIGYGDGLFGLHRAFEELEAMGLADMPRLSGGEIYGSLSAALRSPGDSIPLVRSDRPTVASSIATSQSAYQALRAVRNSGGSVAQVTDEDLIAAGQMLARWEGLFVESAAAAGLAALRRHVLRGIVGAEDDVVLVSTSAGVKSVVALGLTEQRDPLIGDTEALARIVPRTVGRAGTRAP